MFRAAATVLVLLTVFGVSLAAECHGKPDPNAKPNLIEPFTGEPVLVNTVPNGKHYTIGEGDYINHIVHLWGTPYEKGFAHGSLRKTEAQQFMNQTWMYLEDQVIQAINGSAHSLGLSQAAIDLIADVGLEAALDLTYDATVEFTNKYFYDEMRGLADGAEIDYLVIRRIHMIGELTKGSCSMYGAWGAARPSAMDGSLLQMRALDWDIQGPFKNFPQLTVYHGDGSPEQGNSFMNIGWTGWIASITGMNVHKIGICEIGVSFPDSTFGNESRIGIPFTNILRDIIQYDTSIDSALQRITDANRTCDLILGVGDGNKNEFRGIEYSHSVANFYDDKNLMPDYPWHPKIENVVYYGMDWLCPAFNQVLANQLNKYHGQITPDITMKYINSIVQTGDLHVAIYDFKEMQVYVATAANSTSTGPKKAYDRQYNRLDMTKVFSESKP